MLFSLGQTILSRTIFPLGSFTKERVRELAVRIGLPTSRKKDSQEICFIGERSYNDYLLRSGAVRPRPGLLIDRHGRTVGTHNGVHNFTIGQRRGLCGGQKYPLYVKQIVPEHRVVVVARRDQLYSLGAIIRDVNWVSVSRIDGPTRTNVMLRYRQSEAKAVITPCAKEAYFLRFSQPQWAVTPGQAAVLYDGNAVLGGGWIDEALYELPADTA